MNRCERGVGLVACPGACGDGERGNVGVRAADPPQDPHAEGRRDERVGVPISIEKGRGGDGDANGG